MSVVSLVREPDTEVRDSVVKLLESLLEDARAGKIDTFMGVIHQTSGGWTEVASTSEIFTEAIGRLEILKQTWIADYLRRSINA
jgi:hypothetical protein